MELKFTFQDGSEAIAHYGVKGQKWGIWNEDTKRKYGILETNAAGAAGGGGAELDEDDPEELLKKGLIDKETADKIREGWDKIAANERDGKYKDLSEEQIAALYDNVTAQYTKKYKDSVDLAATVADINKYNPNLPGGRENQEALANHLIEEGVNGIKDAVNTHLLDIQAGQISDGEARVIAVLNAASQAMTGSPAINNPKGHPAAYQEKKLDKSDDLVMIGDRKDRERAASKWKPRG